MIHLDIGLVNNMPDSALEATERQFRRLLEDASEAAGEGMKIHLSLFALPDVRRSDEGMQRIEGHYSSIRELWNNSLDGLIVTGAEPLARNLKDEPYWASLTQLVDWADHNTHSAIWSCLAAHGALQHIEGIERRRLRDKLFGVYEFAKGPDHFLTAGARPQLCVPHSRWNDIPRDALKACGYQVLRQSEGEGADTFVRPDSGSRKKSLFVFFQGHPEYESTSLLLEYRRDIHRFLRKQRDTYPLMPQGYFGDSAIEELNALRGRAILERREELLADFPVAAAAATVRDTWRPAAVGVYANWLRYLRAQKEFRLQGQARPRSLQSSEYRRA